MADSSLEHQPSNWTRSTEVALLEPPVPGVYFSTPRHEAKHPVVVGGTRGDLAHRAHAFARMAVLLGGEDLQIEFRWFGPVTADEADLLKSANVRHLPGGDDLVWAQHLADAWVYLSLDTSIHAAHDIARAMAVGTPCLAVDSARNRSAVEHGVNGFLCSGAVPDIMDHLASLIDSTDLRATLSDNSRHHALERYSPRVFKRRLLKLYRLSDKA